MTKKTNTSKEQMTAEPTTVAPSSTVQDLKNSVLIVSIVANLYVITAWIALQVTTQYDNQLASFLFNR